nr:6-bladed beta-propeller [Acanthopleuribacter pedis]
MNVDALSEVRFFDQLLDFHTAIPLEQNDVALFENASLLKSVPDGYFLTNDKGDELYRYHLDGTFDKVVARKGEGPGEISQLSYATLIFDNQIAFWDVYRHSIFVFSLDGTHRFTLNFRTKQLTGLNWLPSGEAFYWNTREEIIFSNIQVRDNEAAQSARVQVIWGDDHRVERLELIQVLGERNLEYERKFSRSGIRHFERVGQVDWLGSPYFSSITLLDYHLNQAKEIAIQVPEPLTMKDYEGLTFDDRRKIHYLINYNGTIHGIIPHPKFVFVKVGFRGYVPFSRDGRQLLKRRLYTRITRYQDFNGEALVYTSSKQMVTKIEEWTHQPLLSAEDRLIADEDHPFLVLASLRDQPRMRSVKAKAKKQE